MKLLKGERPSLASADQSGFIGDNGIFDVTHVQQWLYHSAIMNQINDGGGLHLFSIYLGQGTGSPLKAAPSARSTNITRFTFLPYSYF